MMAPTLGELETKYFPAGPFLGTPHSGDTVVTPLVDGLEFFSAVYDVLASCTGSKDDRIYVASWVFDPDLILKPGTKSLGTILTDLAATGADVRIIIGAGRFGLGTEGFWPWDATWWTATLLKAQPELGKVMKGNVRAARALRAVSRDGNRPLESRVLLDWGGNVDSRHEKSTVIYSAATNKLHAFVGGIDYEPLRMADESHANGWWHDAAVKLEEGAAEAVLGNFRTRWTETATLPGMRYMLDGVVEPFNPLITMSNPSPAPSPRPSLPTEVTKPSYLGSSIRVLRSYDKIRVRAPFYADDLPQDIPWATLPSTGIREIYTAIKNAIETAKTYIYIEDQTLNPPSIHELYIKHRMLYPSLSKACAHGIKVIFVTQGIEAPGKPLHPSRSGEIRDFLLAPLSSDQRENFALHHIKDTKVHSKLVLVDDEFVSIGSANLWDRSMTGTESELTAAIVHPGGEDSLIADLRVRLWRGHLRVPQTDSIDAELRSLSKSLGLFREGWGSAVTFEHPNSALVEILI